LEVYIRDYIQKELKTDFKFSEPFIIFVCDVDEIPKKELYIISRIIIIYFMRGHILKCSY
jgi:hypothetical protein